MRRFFASLFGQVIAALVLGIVVGMVWPGFAIALKPLGEVGNPADTEVYTSQKFKVVR